MDYSLRAGCGAKYFVFLRAMWQRTENVYTRAADGPATSFLDAHVHVKIPRHVQFAETNPPFRSIPSHRRETKRCNDIAK
jgi:hypothetical protein